MDLINIAVLEDFFLFISFFYTNNTTFDLDSSA